MRHWLPARPVCLPRRLRPGFVGVLVALCLLLLYTRSNDRSTWSAAAPALPQLNDGLNPVQAQGSEPGLTIEGALSPPSLPLAQSPIPVIIFTYNRPDYLRRTLDSVLAALPPDRSLHPIFVSQDDFGPGTEQVIASYEDQVTHLRFVWDGDRRKKVSKIYTKIARHYEFALTEVMDRVEGHEKWDRVIMLEDDMQLAPDFFPYFRRMAPLFDTDPSLYCVSAWNTNGQAPLVASPTATYRTECFPGLGWMWSRALWNELRGWTYAWWDEWLRDPVQRKGRSCIIPEVSRVTTFGERGASRGEFFSYFEAMRLNDVNVDWEAVDLGYLPQQQYNAWMTEQLQATVSAVGWEEARKAISRELDIDGKAVEDVKERWIGYRDLDHLTAMMGDIGLITKHKAGMPRASYRGVIHVRHRGVRVWLVPDNLSLPVV
ncbi:GNT-I family-domain-containing protein [Neohortaea acidophila]|uniref:alpha-1,3-mannosyl-glycoprotein 2-beta-N-acetylglucosaminyltransferase n=1 Tax=Neohortaea acidophila TaxID=245834 RepID=A0A6A6PVC0_9PEZI|nr:GNT-I family-domain-containing protein [Neohortaea acidophila]KAF2484070.1 GNT-I family-domain-containing protein [Neohortaea acidophila]